MNYSADSIVRVLVIILIAVVLIWIVTTFLPALGLPAIVATLLNLIIGVSALVAILKAVGLLS